MVAEKRPGVVDVRIKECSAADEATLRLWEKVWLFDVLTNKEGRMLIDLYTAGGAVKKHHPLPRDLRDFYLTTNGMLLRWSMREADGQVVKLGRLSVSPVDKLLPIPMHVRPGIGMWLLCTG